MTQEVWTDVIGYNGLYEVSNWGNVRTSKRQGTKGGLLNTTITKYGYKRIMLYKKGKYKNYFIHRLVAKHFIPNPQKYPFVNHKDENKTNNHVDNLEWCTARYNLNYGTHNKKISETLKGRRIKPVVAVVAKNIMNGNIMHFDSISDAERKGFCHSNIIACCKGRRSKYKGYYWTYKK